jgi:NADPH-dependent 2,4-dienoyl-CoA reductase/sulfur reductase-like enzyme
LNIPGSRPSGVLTAGTAQRFVNVEGFLPGKRIVILGSGDIGMIMARRLTLEGAKVEAVVEILPYIGGLIRNEVQCLHDFDIPLYLQHTVTQIHGEERVTAVTIAKVDADRNPVPGTQRKIQCDSLLLSAGLIPENELSLMAGIRLDPVTGGAVVDETRQTNIAGVFAGGNVLHVHDLVDNVSWESELAGESAAKFAMERDLGEKGTINLKAGTNIRYIVPQTISGQRDTTLYMRVNEPQENVRIKIGDIMTKTVRAVKPSEMIKIELSSEKLQKVNKETKEIIVSCEKRGGK